MAEAFQPKIANFQVNFTLSIPLLYIWSVNYNLGVFTQNLQRILSLYSITSNGKVTPTWLYKNLSYFNASLKWSENLYLNAKIKCLNWKRGTFLHSKNFFKKTPTFWCDFPTKNHEFPDDFMLKMGSPLSSKKSH